MIQLRTAEELQVVQEALQQQVPKPTVELANVGVATGLAESLVLNYRGHLYRVPPIPYVIGVKLERIRLALDKAAEEPETEAQFDQLVILFKDAVGLFHKAVLPVSPVSRAFWGWKANPFRDASAADIAYLIHFFSLCRTRSAVRLQADSVFLGDLSRS